MVFWAKLQEFWAAFTLGEMMRMLLEVALVYLICTCALMYTPVVNFAELKAIKGVLVVGFTLALGTVGIVRWIKHTWDASVVKNIETAKSNDIVIQRQKDSDIDKEHTLLIAFAEHHGKYQVNRHKSPHRLISVEHGEWLPPTALTVIDKKE